MLALRFLRRLFDFVVTRLTHSYGCMNAKATDLCLVTAASGKQRNNKFKQESDLSFTVFW